jgi:hypothetical protein
MAAFLSGELQQGSAALPLPYGRAMTATLGDDARSAGGAVGAAPTTGNERPRPDRLGGPIERISYLFDVLRKPGGGEYTVSDVAKWIAHNGGGVSQPYLYRIRKGTQQPDLGTTVVRRIAAFFCVPVGALVDDAPEAIDVANARMRMLLRDSPELATVLLDDPGATELLLAYAALGPQNRAATRDIVAGTRQLESASA